MRRRAAADAAAAVLAAALVLAVAASAAVAGAPGAAPVPPQAAAVDDAVSPALDEDPPSDPGGIPSARELDPPEAVSPALLAGGGAAGGASAVETKPGKPAEVKGESVVEEAAAGEAAAGEAAAGEAADGEVVVAGGDVAAAEEPGGGAAAAAAKPATPVKPVKPADPAPPAEAAEPPEPAPASQEAQEGQDLKAGLNEAAAEKKQKDEAAERESAKPEAAQAPAAAPAQAPAHAPARAPAPAPPAAPAPAPAAAPAPAPAAAPAAPALAPPAPSPSPKPPQAHMSLFGKQEFAKAISAESVVSGGDGGKSGLVFVKFFSPRCPHCRAMAEAFRQLAFKLRDVDKAAVEVAEVDCTKFVNRVVCDDHVPAGYPTLKMFKRGRLVSEYHGVRDLDSMRSWVLRAVKFDTAPMVSRLRTADAVRVFLSELHDHPVVLFALNGTSAELRSEWGATLEEMRAKSATNVGFAAVDDWQLLLGAHDSPIAQSFLESNRYGVPPVAVGSSSAALFARNGSRDWFFDGVTGSDSLGTFMHLASLPPKGGAVMTPTNARFLSATTSVLAVVFDRGSGPSWATEDLLESLSVEPGVTPLFASSTDLKLFRDHVGLPSLKSAVSLSDYGKVDFGLYRAADGGVEKVIFNDTDHTSLDMIKFLHQYLEWGVNRTKRTSADPPEHEPVRVVTVLDESGGSDAFPGITAASIALTKLPVLDVVASTWSRYVERDGRAVLLLLYSGECAACRAFMPTFDAVSAELIPDVRSVFCARLDLSENELPPYLARPNRVPAVVALVAGALPVTYNGSASTKDIVAFARYHAAPPHLKEILHVEDFAYDVAARLQAPTTSQMMISALSFVMMLLGTWIAGVGMLLELRARARYRRRKGSRRENGESLRDRGRGGDFGGSGGLLSDPFSLKVQ